MSSASSKAGRGSSPASGELARVALVVAARFAADGYALFVAHFRAVSDDDYARVVIAETFAHAPRLDPSGTSWLPAPFWVTGAAMMAFGRSLEVARAVAVVLGIGSSLLVYAGVKRAIGDPGRAAWAAALATWVPWSVYLGVATVPELPAAALGFFGVCCLVDAADQAPSLATRGAGAAAIAAACLMRYEAWPLAAAFALVTAVDAGRARGSRRAELAGAALVAVTAPVAWMAWNGAAHGDPLHFAARVAAFARATKAEGGAATGPFTYIVAALLDRPAITVAVVAALAWCVFQRETLGGELASWRRPALVGAFQLVALGAARLGDASPTHHPERAALAVWLGLAAAASALVLRATGTARRGVGIAIVAAAAVALAVSLATPAGTVGRSDEEAVGRVAGRASSADDRLLVQVADYGYLAVVAASGRPELTVAERSIDPRATATASAFEDAPALERRLEETDPRLVAARLDSAAPGLLGEPLVRAGSWAVWRAGHRPR